MTSLKVLNGFAAGGSSLLDGPSSLRATHKHSHLTEPPPDRGGFQDTDGSLRVERPGDRLRPTKEQPRHLERVGQELRRARLFSSCVGSMEGALATPGAWAKATMAVGAPATSLLTAERLRSWRHS